MDQLKLAYLPMVLTQQVYQYSAQKCAQFAFIEVFETVCTVAHGARSGKSGGQFFYFVRVCCVISFNNKIS